MAALAKFLFQMLLMAFILLWLEDIQKGLSMEAEHYIVKPCSVDKILAAIQLVAKLIPRHKSSSEVDDEIELIE